MPRRDSLGADARHGQSAQLQLWGSRGRSSCGNMCVFRLDESCLINQKLDDGWPESEKDVCQAALRCSEHSSRKRNG